MSSFGPASCAARCFKCCIAAAWSGAAILHAMSWCHRAVTPEKLFPVNWAWPAEVMQHVSNQQAACHAETGTTLAQAGKSYLWQDLTALQQERLIIPMEMVQQVCQCHADSILTSSCQAQFSSKLEVTPACSRRPMLD